MDDILPGVSQIVMDCRIKVTFKKPSPLPGFGGQKENRVETHHLFSSTSLLYPPISCLSPPFLTFSALHLGLPFSCPDLFSSALLAAHPVSPSSLCHTCSLPPHSPTIFSLLSQPSFSSKIKHSCPIHLVFVQLLLCSQLVPNPTLLNFLLLPVWFYSSNTSASHHRITSPSTE